MGEGKTMGVVFYDSYFNLVVFATMITVDK
jgi:hypothetical protein